MSYCSGDEYSERIAAILENPKTHHKTGEIGVKDLCPGGMLSQALAFTELQCRPHNSVFRTVFKTPLTDDIPGTVRSPHPADPRLSADPLSHPGRTPHGIKRLSISAFKPRKASVSKTNHGGHCFVSRRKLRQTFPNRL